MKRAELHQEYEGFLKDQTHVKPSTLHLLRAKLRILPAPDKITGAWFKRRMKEVAPSTIKAEVILAKRFLKWSGRDTSDLEKDKLKLPRLEDTITVADLYTKDELAAIFRNCSHVRDRAMLEVLYESALRANELLTMTFKNTTFNEDGTATIIISGKTGTRSVPLFESVPALKMWLDVHPTGEGPVWLKHVRPFHAISARHLHYTLEMALSRAEIKGKKKLVHMMRHTRATELVRLGVRGQVLSKLMGWTKKSNMEAVYIHLSTEDVTNEVHAKVFGLDTKEEAKRPLLESMICLNEKCKTKNDPSAKFCSKCKWPLSNDAIANALRQQEQKREEIERLVQERVREEMLRQQTLVSEETLRIFREDPEILKASFVTLLSDPEILKVLASAVADSLVQEREKQTSSITEPNDG